MMANSQLDAGNPCGGHTTMCPPPISAQKESPKKKSIIHLVRIKVNPPLPLRLSLDQRCWRQCGTCCSGWCGSSAAVAASASPVAADQTATMQSKQFTHRDGHLDGAFALKHIGCAAN